MSKPNQFRILNAFHVAAYIIYVLIFARRRRTAGLNHFPDHLSANLGDGLVLRQSDIGKQRSVASDGRVCVALDVGTKFPTGGVGVTSTDVLCLKALELLLGSEFVGLILLEVKDIAMGLDGMYHCLLIYFCLSAGGADREMMKVDATDRLPDKISCLSGTSLYA
jgi:hypothetical protein